MRNYSKPIMEKERKSRSRTKHQNSLWYHPVIENWFCVKCGYVNNGFRERCGHCGEKKPVEDSFAKFRTREK